MKRHAAEISEASGGGLARGLNGLQLKELHLSVLQGLDLIPDELSFLVREDSHEDPLVFEALTPSSRCDLGKDHPGPTIVSAGAGLTRLGRGARAVLELLIVLCAEEEVELSQSPDHPVEVLPQLKDPATDQQAV